MQISVIIPAYNRVSLLTRAIESVLKQTRQADEIIVVDDGSKDSTAIEIPRRYPEILFLKQKHQGVSSARNLGIEKAQFEWLALLDSDDEWLPAKLESQTGALEKNPQYKIAHSDEIWIRNGKRVNPMRKHKKHGGHIFRHCLPLCCISPSSAILHRSLFEELGPFDEDLPACEDYELWLRVCSRYRVLFLEEKLIIKYGGHADQLSQAHWGMDRFRILALDKLLSQGQLNEEQRMQTIHMLINKATIFLNGARKRNNHSHDEIFTGLLKKYSKELKNDTLIKT